MLQQFYALRDYVLYCIDADFGAPVCRDFWLSTAGIAFFLGFGILTLILRQQLRVYLEFRRNRKHLEARKIVADEETMERHKWQGDAASDGDMNQVELAARIKQEIEARKHPAT